MKFNLSEWALEHKSFIWILMAIAVVAGVMSYQRLGREEDPAAEGRAHSSSSFTLASASRIISGKATAPTTVCESATSGACQTKKRMPRIRP